MAERTTQTFGDYILHRRLGGGGMADVFLAQRQGSSRPVVIKQLRKALPMTAGPRMRREAQAGVYLQHPNIVETIDAGTIDGTFYIAVELIVGRDLGELLKRAAETKERIPVHITVAVALGVLDALAYAHAARGPDGRPLELVHRDLSPNNVMVQADGGIKVIDFGLVRANLGDFRTAPGVVMGTYRYLSPEQATGDPADARSDLYTLSVVLHEMLTGEPTIKGTTPALILGAVVTQMFPPIRAANPAVPEALAAVIARGLEKQADARFASALEYADAVRGAAEDLASGPSEVGAYVIDQFPEVLDLRAEVEELLQAADTPAHELHMATVTGALAPDSAALADTVIRRPRVDGSAPQRTTTKWPWVFGVAALGATAAAFLTIQLGSTKPYESQTVPQSNPVAPAVGVSPRALPVPTPPTNPRPRVREPRRLTRKLLPKQSPERAPASVSPGPTSTVELDPPAPPRLESLEQRARRLSRTAPSEALTNLLADMTLFRSAGSRDEDGRERIEFERRLRALEGAASR